MKPHHKKPSGAAAEHDPAIQGLAASFDVGDYKALREQARHIEQSPQADPHICKQAQAWRRRTEIDPIAPALGLAVLAANIIVLLMAGQ